MSKRKKQEWDEVDFKLKSGTAWSHNYLNQKPWHPLSYPNQRRKWIAEQMHHQSTKLQKEVEREFEQEQEFFKNSGQLSKKEKEKLEAIQAVSFMYARPPGYNAESARAAELADEQKAAAAAAGTAPGKEAAPAGTTESLALGTGPSDSLPGVDAGAAPPAGVEEKKKPRPKDVFGRKIATAEDFPELKNAPKMETGIVGRARPFGVELRNVRCLRCGAMGHQSGDRDCTMKDELTSAELARQRREDPLSQILASTADEPVKWELKQQPGGGSPIRGGFRREDPNQQILAPEETLDEYGGFLGGLGDEENGTAAAGAVLDLLAEKKRKERKRERRKEKERRRIEKEVRRRLRQERRERKRRKARKRGRDNDGESDSEEEDGRSRRKAKRAKRRHEDSSTESDDTSGSDETGSGSDEQDRSAKRRSHRKRVKRRGKDSNSESSDEEGARKRRRTRRVSSGSEDESDKERAVRAKDRRADGKGAERKEDEGEGRNGSKRKHDKNLKEASAGEAGEGKAADGRRGDHEEEGGKRPKSKERRSVNGTDQHTAHDGGREKGRKKGEAEERRKRYSSSDDDSSEHHRRRHRKRVKRSDSSSGSESDEREARGRKEKRR